MGWDRLDMRKILGKEKFLREFVIFNSKLGVANLNLYGCPLNDGELKRSRSKDPIFSIATSNRLDIHYGAEINLHDIKEIVCVRSRHDIKVQV